MTITLRESERRRLRDWYDQGGAWVARMSALYRIVEHIIARRQADALRAAADEMWAIADSADAPPDDFIGWSRWLRSRADEIEGGDDNA